MICREHYRKEQGKSETPFSISPALYGAIPSAASSPQRFASFSVALTQARAGAGSRCRRMPRAHFYNKSFKGTRVSLVRCTEVVSRAP